MRWIHFLIANGFGHELVRCHPLPSTFYFYRSTEFTHYQKVAASTMLKPLLLLIHQCIFWLGMHPEGKSKALTMFNVRKWTQAHDVILMSWLRRTILDLGSTLQSGTRGQWNWFSTWADPILNYECFHSDSLKVILQESALVLCSEFDIDANNPGSVVSIYMLRSNIAQRSPIIRLLNLSIPSTTMVLSLQLAM